MVVPTDAREVRALWFLWGAMLWSIVLYGIVGMFVQRSTGVAERGPSPAILGQLLPVVALLTGVGSWVVRAPLARQGNYRTYCVVRWALAEAVAVIGLVFAVTGGALNLFAAFLAAAVVLLVWYRPSAADREDFAARRGQEVSR